MKRAPEKPSKLSESLHQRLNSYALAASAAGVGILAVATPAELTLPAGATLTGVFALSESAEARVVYTPTKRNVVCHTTDGGSCHGTLDLNLNHGSGVEFQLFCDFVHGPGRLLSVSPVGASNQIWTSSLYSGDAAAALDKGALIQSSEHFLNFREGRMFWTSGGEGRHGPWVHVKNLKYRYLGLKFTIKGQIHYGWARISTPIHWFKGASFATLTGYAYETIPNKPIVAGRTKGPDVITLEPGSLGALAAGTVKPRRVEE